MARKPGPPLAAVHSAPGWVRAVDRGRVADDRGKCPDEYCIRRDRQLSAYAPYMEQIGGARCGVMSGCRRVRGDDSQRNGTPAVTQDRPSLTFQTGGRQLAPADRQSESIHVPAAAHLRQGVRAWMPAAARRAFTASIRRPKCNRSRTSLVRRSFRLVRREMRFTSGVPGDTATKPVTASRAPRWSTRRSRSRRVP